MCYYDRTNLNEGIDPAKHVLPATIGFLIIGLNFEILFVMIVMIWGFWSTDFLF